MRTALKLRRKLLTFITVTVLITLLQGCATIRIEERYVVPELSFPVFPFAKNIVNNSDGTVTSDAEWIVRLEEFRIRYAELMCDYEGIKELYMEEHE